MTEPLDVSLRVRMRYEAGGSARQAIGDIEQIRTKANQLGTQAVGDRLGRGMVDLATQAGAARGQVVNLADAAARLGSAAGAARLEADVKRVVAPAQAATRELQAMGAASARFGAVSTVSLVHRDVVKLTGSLQGARGSTVALTASVDRLGQARGVQALDRELERVGRRADDVRRRVDRVGRRDRERYDFGNEFLHGSGLGGGMRLGMSAAAAGGLAAGTGAAAGAGTIALASREAIRFESAMAEVRKAVDNLTPDAFAEMERAILRTSRSTGIAKEEMAKLVAQAGFAGRPAEDLTRFAEFGAKAAIAFGMTADEAGDKLAKLGNVFKLTQGGIEDLADGINVLGDNTASKERQIVDFLYRTGQTGQALKLTALQTAAFGAAAVSVGKEAEVAATGFNAFAMKLGQADRQGDDFKKGLRTIGISVRGLKRDMAANPVEALLNVLDRINKLPEAKKLDVAGRLGGMEYADDLLSMAGSVTEVRKALALMQDQATRSGSVEKTFRIFDATTQRGIDRAQAQMMAFATKVGQLFTPTILAAARAVERWFGGMNKSWEVREKAEGLARKMVDGKELSAKEKAEIEANPRLKSQVEQQRFYRERASEFERSRERAVAPPLAPYAPGPTMEDARRSFERRREEFEAKRRGESAPKADPQIPGTGKRSDLSDAVRASLAAYNDEVDRSLTKTERLVHQASLRMREDLSLRGRVDLGGGGGATVQSAALGGGGLGGGLGGGGGGFGHGRMMPGRFGGMGLPERGGGGGGRGGGGRGGGGGGPSARDGARYGNGGGAGGNRAPTNAEGRENVQSWLAFAQRSVEEGGLGLTKEQAHGLVAGLQGESGANLNPGAYNGNDRGMPAGGTAQWRNDRLRNLQRFAQERGKDWRDRTVQQEFMRHEMLGSGANGGGSERGAYEAIRRQQDRHGALGAMVRRYERPQYPGAEIGKRSQYLNGHEGGGATAEGGRAPNAGEAGANGQHDPLGGAARRYSSGYGMRNHPVIGGRRMHHGQDMAAPAGTGVNAMQGGRVTAINRHGDVTVTHSDGSTKTYRHINPEGLEVGQQVEGGQRIGNLREGRRRPGGDPRSTGPHLHLEATDPEGRRIDPMPQIREANRRREAPAVAEGPMQNMPESWRRRLAPEGGAEMVSPRFSEPRRLQVNARGGAERTGGMVMPGGGGESRPAVQNFYGGFDEQTVARRAQLEQNRSIRRAQAGAMHDIGRVG